MPQLGEEVKNPKVDFGVLSGLCAARVKDHVGGK